jgi:hypothetical protein
MSARQPEPGDEPWLSREEIVEREYQIKRQKYEEAQRWIDERCRLAEARWRAAHPWLAPGWCTTVHVRQLYLPDPQE